MDGRTMTEPPQQTRLATLLRAAPGAGCRDPDAAEHALADAIAAARRAYPRVALAEPIFLEFLGERLAGAEELVQALGELQVGDLLLACACARGEPAALEAFETHVLGKLEPALRRMRLGAAQLADLKQTLRVLLFVSDGSAPPKIAQYSGRAPLAAWAQVVATRAALRYKRTEAQHALGEEEALYELPAPGDAPELSYLKRRYQQPFREAFREALAELGARERTLLRQSFIDGLSIDELGRLYRVHRVTASRWVVQARRALLSGTRARLMARISVDEPECDRIMHLVRSRLDVTLRGLFATSARPPERE
jgi:RNA polymerase sigma-70 factor (ECF subfamily)